MILACSGGIAGDSKPIRGRQKASDSAMYYDLIASLPRLPYFQHADRLPITPLRLAQRLRRLRPDHAAQLNRARPVIRWRPERLASPSDRSTIDAFSELLNAALNTPLREYIEYRLTQQTLLAALRRKNDGLGVLEQPKTSATGSLVYSLRRNWDAPYFGLKYRYPWLPEASDKLSAGDAMGLERLLMDLHWQWLTRRAEQSMFGIEAVVAFVLKWDMLHAWLAGDSHRAQVRFTHLIDQVTHVEIQ